MIMKNKKVLAFVVLLLVVVFGASFPFIISKNVDDLIDKKRVEFKDYGINLKVDSKDGYVDTIRHISIDIENGRHFANGFFKILEKKYPENKELFTTILYEKNIDWDFIFSGTKIDGELKNSNFLLQTPTLTIHLKELSKDIMTQLKDDKKASKVILPILDKKSLSATLNFTNQGNIKELIFKDIKESFREDDTKLSFDFLKPKYEILNHKEEKFTFSKFAIHFEEGDESLHWDIDDFSSSSKREDRLNYEYNSKISNFMFILNERNKLKLSIQNINNFNKTSSNNQKVNSKQQLSFDDMNLTIKNNNISSKNMKLDINIENIDKDSLLKVIDDYSSLEFDFTKYSQNNIDNLFSLFNKGFDFKTKIQIDELNTPFSSNSNFIVDTTINLLENEINKENFSVDNLKEKIQLDALIKIDNQTYEKIVSIDETIKNFEDLAKKEGEYTIFKISKKDSSIKINDKDSSLIANTLGDIQFENENYLKAINFYKYAVENGYDYSNYRLAYSYNEMKMYDLALSHYNLFLEKYPNDKNTLYNIAYVYAYGKEDYEEAIKWFKKSLELGYEAANFDIAYCYDILDDFENAVKWYEKSVEIENEVYAMWNLAVIYENGKGNVKKDLNRAFELYLLAANLGYEDAYDVVAEFYTEGKGTAVNLQEAKFWKNKK